MSENDTPRPPEEPNSADRFGESDSAGWPDESSGTDESARPESPDSAAEREPSDSIERAPDRRPDLLTLVAGVLSAGVAVFVLFDMTVGRHWQWLLALVVIVVGAIMLVLSAVPRRRMVKR